MTPAITFQEYAVLANRTAKCLGHFDLVHAALGAASEVGEIATTVKAHFIYNKPLDVQNLVEEIGDTLWFLALLAKAIDVPLEQCANENIAKLRARYPNRYTDHDALERKDKQKHDNAIKPSNEQSHFGSPSTD